MNGLDGCVYFGVKDNEFKSEINDFIIPTLDQERKHEGRHFYIHYCLYTN